MENEQNILSKNPVSWSNKLLRLFLCGVFLFVVYSIGSALLMDDFPSLPLLKSQRAITVHLILATLLCLFVSICVLSLKSALPIGGKRKMVLISLVVTGMSFVATVAATIGMAKHNQSECEHIDDLVLEAYTYLLRQDKEPRLTEISGKYFTRDFQDSWAKCLKKEKGSSVPLFPFNPWLYDEESFDKNNISVKIKEGAYIQSGYIYTDVSLLITDGKDSSVVKVEIAPDNGEYKIHDIEYGGKCIAYYHSEDGKTVQEISNLYTYMTWFHYGQLSYDRYANPNKQSYREPVSVDDWSLKEEEYKVKDCINMLKMSESHLRVYLLTNDYISLGEKNMYHNPRFPPEKR